jgi:hypothetical protein
MLPQPLDCRIKFAVETVAYTKTMGLFEKCRNVASPEKILERVTDFIGTRQSIFENQRK